MGYKYAAQQFLRSSEEAFRYASYRVLLPYVTDSSSRALAARAAKILGFILATSPISGRLTFNLFRRSFGLGTKEAFAKSRAWFSGPFRDFVILRRALESREEKDV